MLSTELLTVAEISARLGVVDQTVREWIKAGELVAINLGGRAGYRVAASDFEAFLVKRRLASIVEREMVDTAE